MISRRHLLSTGAPAVLLGQASSDEVKVAFIGVGTRGSYLVRTMARVPNAKIAAIADLDQERAAAAAAPHQAKVYTDFRKMLDENKDVQAVVIATPVFTHKDLAIAALEVGKNVYLEKPVGLTPEECGQVAQAVKSAKGILQVGFQLRHDAARRASIDFIKQGKLGKVIYMHAMRHGGDLQRARAWYFDKTKSGDIIVEQACHIIDLMVWIAGAPPVRAMGSGGINLFKDVPEKRTVMDNWSAIWEWPGGLRFNMSQHYFDPRGFTGTHERVWGSEGAIELPDATFHPLEKGERVKLEIDASLDKDAGYNALAAFLDNARGRKKPLNDIESARTSTLAAMMARKSIYEGRPVTWKEISR